MAVEGSLYKWNMDVDSGLVTLGGDKDLLYITRMDEMMMQRVRLGGGKKLLGSYVNSGGLLVVAEDWGLHLFTVCEKTGVFSLEFVGQCGYLCPHCLLTVEDKRWLSRHMEQHLGPVICSRSGSQFIFTKHSK